jgi:hypothetical protein
MRGPIAAVFLALIAICPGQSALAQSPRKPRIDIVDIQGVLLTDKGVSAGPSEVTYKIEFVPANAVRAEVQLLRDREVIKSFPAPMKAGLNKVTLPAGLQMENPFDLILAQVALPGGKLSESSGRSIYEAADFAKRDARARARLDRIIPDIITAKRGPQTVQIFGADLAAVAGTLTVGGIGVDARVVGNSLHVTVPPGVFQLPGFTLVAPQMDFMATPLPSHQQLLLAVADPKLPKPGGLETVRIDGVDYEGDGDNDRLRVRGVGFRPSMQIVIGRGQTPIAAQPLEMESTTVVRTWLATGMPAEDYFIALLSSDGKQLSKAFPIASPDRMRASRQAPAVSPDEPRLTPPGFQVFGDLAWNVTTPQFLYLEGPIARPGLRVWLRREGEPIAVEAVAADAATASGRKHPVVRVPVPASLTHKAVYTISVVIHTR